MGEGFHDYNASNGDYYASRGAVPAIFEILSGLVKYKSRPCEGKLKHRSIELPYVSPAEGRQGLGEGFLCYLGPKGR